MYIKKEQNQNNSPKILDEMLKTKRNIETDNSKKVNLFTALINKDKSIEYYSIKSAKTSYKEDKYI